MQPFSLGEFLAQLGLAPRLVPPPAPAPAQPPPYDTSVVPGVAFGEPYPSPAPGETATPGDYGSHDMTPIGVKQSGVVPVDQRYGAAPVDQNYGYAPQARPDLPSQLGDTGINPDLFNTYRSLYAPAAQDQDPIARLLGDQTAGLPGFRPDPGPSRALTPPGYAHQAGPQYGAQGGMGMSPGEQRLRARGPAFNRVADRFHELSAMRARRGF